LDDRFDALVRALPLGVIMLRRNKRLRFANRAAAAIFGFDRARAKGLHLIETIPSVELERRVDAALAGEAAATAPLIVTGKRTDRSYAVTVYPLRISRRGEDEEGGEISGALILAEDQTEQLALERTRQEFLSNVSHELRTPLSSVKLMLETLVQGGDDDARAVFLPQALREVDRLAGLVQRFLEQARAESGQPMLRIEEVDLEAVVRAVLQPLQRQAAAKRISLDLRAHRPVIVEADGQQLSQVLVNLIDNALRFTPAGGSVTVDLDVEDGYAKIVVSDTGIGIPYKDIPYVFERFFVADRSRARGVTGAGLGLSIVKQIVESHEGTITVQSVLDAGTQFTVRIPMIARVS
jgi:two-component system phosphate regulon sensor histidine kinase PhoR